MKKLVAKRWIFLVMVVLVTVGLVGCSSSTPPTPTTTSTTSPTSTPAPSAPVKEEIKPSQQNIEATKDYLSFSDEKNGFSIKYPSNWKKDTESKDAAVTFITGEAEALNVIVADSGGFKLNDIITVAVPELEKSISNFKMIENTTVTMGSMPAQKLVYSGSMSGVNLKFMQYITVVNKKQYVITYSAADGFDKNLSTVQNVIGSLSI